MKQDRFLTAILLGIAFLILLSLTVFFTRQDDLTYVDDSTPQGVVQNYILALQKRDYEKAYAYLADLENKPTYEQFRESFFNHSISALAIGAEILQTETSVNLATVDLSIIDYNQRDPFASSSRYVQSAQLVRQAGNWKIRQMPYQFWSYDWFQPTPVK